MPLGAHGRRPLEPRLGRARSARRCTRARAGRRARGRWRASHMATAPPIERPHTETRSSPSRSSSSSASPASSSIVYGPGRRRRAAVAALVVAHTPEARLRAADLRLPQLERVPSEFDEQEAARPRPVDPMMQPHVRPPPSHAARARGRPGPRRSRGRSSGSSSGRHLVRGEARPARPQRAPSGTSPSPRAVATTSCASARPTLGASRCDTARRAGALRSRRGSGASARRRPRDRRAPRRRSPPRLRRSASAPESAAHSACHAPAARSCSPSSAAEQDRRVPARLARRTRRRAPTRRGCASGASSRRPPPAPSATSPTSVCERSDDVAPRSCRRPRPPPPVRRPARRSAAGRRATAPAARPGRARGRRAAPTSSPASPSAASVPAAPPSWAARRSRRIRSRPSRASISATSQTAHFSPNVVGTACWSSVRPAIAVARCARASSAQRSAGRVEPAADEASARFETSIAAVSMMSWLVAPPVDVARLPLRRPPPRARGRAARPGSRRRGRLRQRGRVEELGPAAVGDRGGGHRRGSRPPSPRRSQAPAPPRAAPRARPGRRRRRAGRPAPRSPRIRSQGEEGRLPVALEADVEPKAVAVRVRDEGRALGGIERREHRVARRSPAPRRGDRCASAPA